MKLVHREDPTNILIEFTEEKTIIHDPLYQEELKSGIVIPPNRRSSYFDLKVVHVTDQLFKRAFKEIFVPHRNLLDRYNWEE